MRSAVRPRRYVARGWLLIFRPILRYSATRDAYVLRAVGSKRGPVLRANRRRRRQQPFAGAERRGVGAA
ncbi:MAG TPA: hypothetical protein VGY76_03620 [Solirubrobacteraceae bacterium]|jgi:hypothetical protein|nr:hypothetical protein [Solirubrobacteraceae bacterium]